MIETAPTGMFSKMAFNEEKPISLIIREPNKVNPPFWRLFKKEMAQ
jgi:hypothetical protein